MCILFQVSNWNYARQGLILEMQFLISGSYVKAMKRFDIYPFEFDFGTKCLPPSFYFDLSEWRNLNTPYGISRSVVGLMACKTAFSTVDPKLLPKEEIPFQITYNDSSALMG